VNGGISQFARAAGRWIPDATAAAALMLFGLGAAALALGDGPGEVVDAWYRGLWMLLPFSMQASAIRWAT
jgi:short subunit fatty acids transporter